MFRILPDVLVTALRTLPMALYQMANKFLFLSLNKIGDKYMRICDVLCVVH